jgi:hypothetical protein
MPVELPLALQPCSAAVPSDGPDLACIGPSDGPDRVESGSTAALHSGGRYPDCGAFARPNFLKTACTLRVSQPISKSGLQ